MPEDPPILKLPLPPDGDIGEGDDEMANVPSNIDEQNIGRIASAGASAHEHFVTFGKVLDYAYEADRKMVSLVESLGVRESTSKSGQMGVPLAGGSA